MPQQFNQFAVQLGDVLRHLGWIEIVDVLVVAVVLYQALLLLAVFGYAWYASCRPHLTAPWRRVPLE